MKTEKIQDAALVHAASEWFNRLRESPVSAEDLSAWLAWYEADPRHREAYDDMQAFWEQSAALAGDAAFMAGIEREMLAPAVPVRAAPGLGEWLREFFQMHRYGFAATAAALLVVSVSLNLGRYGAEAPEQAVVTLEGPHAFVAEAAAPAPEASPVRSAPELQKEAYLSDGSQVTLAEKSAVSVQFSRNKRLLVMDPGVAYFTVAHNTKRPFIVKAGNVYVRAVGTAFNVRSTGSRTVVTVTQGTVDVYPVEKSEEGDLPEKGVVRAQAGKEVAWAAISDVPTVASVDVSHALAWKKGMLEYLNEPLGSAIQDINRYAKRPIVIEDAAVADILFSGTVFTDSTDSWVRSLPNLFPVEVAADPRGKTIVIRARKTS